MHTPEEIENSKIELAESYRRLCKNKDFKKIVLEGLLETGSVFLTKNLMKVKPEYEDDIIVQMKARSVVYKYFDDIEEEAASILEARAV